MSTINPTSGSGTDTNVDPSFAVLKAVSDTTDTPIRDLPPLNDAVDPEALNALFSGRQSVGRIQFAYAGHVVTVHADRTVEVSREA